VRERGQVSAVALESKLGAEKQKTQVQATSNLQAHVADEYVYSVTGVEEGVTNICHREPTPKPEIAQEPELSEPINEAEALEARRKRREAIRAKHRSQATPLHLKALNVSEVETDSSTPSTEPASAKEASGMFLSNKLALISAKLTSVNSIDSPRASPFEQPADAFPGFSIGKDMDTINANAPVVDADKNGPSAADYDPTLDTKEESQKHGSVQERKHDVSSAAYDETKPGKQDILLPDAPPAPAPKADSFDMFADDDDDMFAEESPDPKPSHASATAVPQGKELDVSMMDNWDDSEGYYAVRLGELINGRYHVHQNLGKGMFSSVVRATDTQTGGPVAVKIIRQNAVMRKAGMKEIGILEQLREADPEQKMHTIKFDRYFDHKGHLCMVFENLSMDLREVLKKYGRDIGLNLRAVRAYGQQIFLGLCLLRKCNILHADLKPDNLLVNEQRNILKICDLGSASPASENEITPYLVSRFYRAPEIILGIPYDFAIDVWSIGCTLFELYTGKILFTGRDNNQMLRSIMECRGKYPPKLLRRGTLSPHHFDEMLNFHSVEQDKLTGRLHTKIVDFKKPTRDLKSRLMAQGTRGMPDSEVKELTMFLDLLDRCLCLNPEKRITPAEALKHPFLAPRV
jgi:serine/threonine-protein kinase PRP4